MSVPRIAAALSRPVPWPDALYLGIEPPRDLDDERKAVVPTATSRDPSEQTA